ncbi:MAG TPA: hypothetical protein VME21_01340 [Steroidobacteraceae bacterium]|nr:hypothetical protein [Steroidobacteraceae bacterium]
MKVSIRSMMALAALSGLALLGERAMAGCGPEWPAAAGMKPMVYRNDAAGALLRTSYGPFNIAAITGLWKFTFTAEGDVGSGAPPNALPFTNGTPVDAGFVTWHDDGTELMNSGRTPASGSFCMGIWKQTGRSTYKLNHWALSWIPDYHPGATDSWSQIPGGIDEMFKAFGPTNIEETITLSDHADEYSGTFRLTQYVNDGTKNPIFDTSGAPVAFVIVGTVSATRVKVD